MLELDDLHRRFGDVQAVAGVSFMVAAGEMVGFVGRNGAGKTTTMRIALGLTRADRGAVRWDGRPVEPEQRRRLFGYLPEERGLYPKMRAIDQLRYFGQLHGLTRADAHRSADEWLSRLGLADRRLDMLDDLSLGNQQRVQLASALLHRPRALVLDEPFSGLDPVGVDTLAEALADEVAGGAGVVFSSHQLELVERLCDRVVIIEAGRVVAAGSIDEVRSARAGRRVVVEVAAELAGDRETATTRTATRTADRPPPDQRPPWLDGVAGVTGVAASGRRWLVDLAPEADDQAVLAAARNVGPVRHFAQAVPTLAELFREVTR